jgi:hypothetical protein
MKPRDDLFFIMKWADGQLDKFRSLLYKWGYRPELGSIFHSPSRAMRYIFEDVDFFGEFRRAIESGGISIEESSRKNHTGYNEKEAP